MPAVVVIRPVNNNVAKGLAAARTGKLPARLPHGEHHRYCLQHLQLQPAACSLNDTAPRAAGAASPAKVADAGTRQVGHSSGLPPAAADIQPAASVLDTLCICDYEEDEDAAVTDTAVGAIAIDTLCLLSYDEEQEAGQEDGGASLRMYNQLRGQLAATLAAGGPTSERASAQLDRLRAAMFHSLATAFPPQPEPLAEEAEACGEDDALCWVG
jgi:hypothetical protein